MNIRFMQLIKINERGAVPKVEFPQRCDVLWRVMTELVTDLTIFLISSWVKEFSFIFSARWRSPAILIKTVWKS